MSWPIEIDAQEFDPVPDSWLDHGIDRDGVGPQCYAVSATVIRNIIKVRYAHPAGTKVGEVRYPGVDGNGGLIPRALADGDWPRSIAAGRLEPIGDIRLEERAFLEEEWAERVDTIPTDSDDGRLIADGGQSTSDTEQFADPSVKYRCGLCHRLFDAVIHGANCPSCGGAALCTFTEEGCS